MLSCCLSRQYVECVTQYVNFLSTWADVYMHCNRRVRKQVQPHETPMKQLFVKRHSVWVESQQRKRLSIPSCMGWTFGQCESNVSLVSATYDKLNEAVIIFYLFIFSLFPSMSHPGPSILCFTLNNGEFCHRGPFCVWNCMTGSSAMIIGWWYYSTLMIPTSTFNSPVKCFLTPILVFAQLISTFLFWYEQHFYLDLSTVHNIWSSVPSKSNDI